MSAGSSTEDLRLRKDSEKLTHCPKKEKGSLGSSPCCAANAPRECARSSFRPWRSRDHQSHSFSVFQGARKFHCRVGLKKKRSQFNK